MIGDKYIFMNVDDVPDELHKNVVYHCYNERRIDLICHCGCGDIISLNTLTDTSPKWAVINPNTISPSINRAVGCKSHFSIKNGIVE
jgi:hypothetical protein